MSTLFESAPAAAAIAEGLCIYLNSGVATVATTQIAVGITLSATGAADEYIDYAGPNFTLPFFASYTGSAPAAGDFLQPSTGGAVAVVNPATTSVVARVVAQAVSDGVGGKVRCVRATFYKPATT